MDESVKIEIRFKSEAETVSLDEIALLESIWPEIIQAMRERDETAALE